MGIISTVYCGATLSRFSNTFVPIEDVNFLVGENNIGKTTILKLIKIFDDPEFWLRQEFNSSEIELGHFKDIVSAKAEIGLN